MINITMDVIFITTTVTDFKKKERMDVQRFIVYELNTRLIILTRLKSILETTVPQTEDSASILTTVTDVW